MSNGIVVDHKESHIRYAIPEDAFNPEVHRKVRDLRFEETVRAYTPKPVPQTPTGRVRPSEDYDDPADTLAYTGRSGERSEDEGDASEDVSEDPSTTPTTGEGDNREDG